MDLFENVSISLMFMHFPDQNGQIMGCCPAWKILDPPLHFSKLKISRIFIVIFVLPIRVFPYAFCRNLWNSIEYDKSLKRELESIWIFSPLSVSLRCSASTSDS